MAQPSNRKKLKPSFIHTLVERPNTVSRTAVARNVALSSRGYAVEQRSLPIKSRWHNWVAADNNEFGLDGLNEDWENEGNTALPDDDGDATSTGKGKRKRSKTSTRPSKVWMDNYRSNYLDELLRWEGTMGRSDRCRDCGISNPSYRCDECNDPAMVCQKCCVTRHNHNPFHIIKFFDKQFFRKISLKDLGLVIQLGHNGGQCTNPSAAHIDFAILHTTGQHSVSLNFCGCEKALPHHIQLLRRRLYPATQAHPKTAATFTLLDFLHVLSLGTQGSMQDMYRTLVRLIDNTGLLGLRSCYKQLNRMLHQYRHLKLLKRGGRGHIDNGIETLQPGDLGIECPTCPHKHTLQEGWENLPADQQYLNRFVGSVDGAFKLKNFFSSSWLADPGFGNGMAYMVPNEELMGHLAANPNKIDEVSTCVDFDAIKRASTKNGGEATTAGGPKPKYRATGVLGFSCARSEMLAPNGVSDLQYGERYINVDFVVGYSLRAFAFLSVLVVSYDIVCQWLVNFWKRMPDWPEHLQLDPLTTKVRGCVPKFHYNAHEALGHSQFSFHCVPGSAQTDGECCERIWDGTNALGKISRTMGPGMRSDTLDDHFGFWNWKKYIGMGKTLKQRYRVAVFTRNNMKAAHEGFTANMKPECVAAWTSEIIAWEKLIETLQSKKLKSPYESDEAVLTDTRLRQLMDAEEAQSVKDGTLRVHSVGPARFIMKGLDIEESQRRLKSETAGKATETTIQRASILERRKALSLRIDSYIALRSMYFSGLPLYLEHISKQEQKRPPVTQDWGSDDHSATESDDDFPESIQLFLPSRIEAPFRTQICTTEAIHAEQQLRSAQMTDCLVNIRRSLRIRTRMIHWKNHQISGQHHGTRSRAVVDQMQARLNNLVEKYRIARIAMISLDPSPEWQLIWRELKPSDVTSYVDTEQSFADAQKFMRRGMRPGGETHRVLSWIWTTTAGVKKNDGDPTGLEGMDDMLRVEWLKSRRRWGGWSEECGLLSVEMARALLHLEAKSTLWISRQTSRSTTDDSLLKEGLRGYALRQAALQQALLNNFGQDFETALLVNDGNTSKLVSEDVADDDDYTPDDEEVQDIM